MDQKKMVKVLFWPEIPGLAKSGPTIFYGYIDWKNSGNHLYVDSMGIGLDIDTELIHTIIEDDEGSFLWQKYRNDS